MWHQSEDAKFMYSQTGKFKQYKHVAVLSIQ